MIRFADVNKKYGKFHALKDVSFSASDDDITGIIGHNGAGKTSLFMIANGLSRPSGGDVLINDISLHKNRDKIQSMTGLYTDNLYLYPMLTVRECLRFFIGVYKYPKTKYDELIETFRLREHERKRVSALSTGLMKRLKLAVCVANNPKVLFLDEPFSGLDPESRSDIIRLIRDIRSGGIQMLISSHELLELELLVNRIILLRNGCVIADDYLDKLTASYFPDKAFDIQLQSPDIAAFCRFLNGQHIDIGESEFVPGGGDIYSFRLGIREYYRIENRLPEDSKLISAASFKPTLDDLYFQINNAFSAGGI